MKKINASTLVEFVIALSIIGICFSVASYIFIQGNRSVIQFQEVREQTEFQSVLFNAFLNDTVPATKEWKRQYTEIETAKENTEVPSKKVYILRSSHKQLWEQEFYMNEKK